MFTIKANADGVNFGPFNIVCTGHHNIVSTGDKKYALTLYRIKDPKLNHIEIWHKRSDSWEYLVRATMNALIADKERNG